jgi:hypothetical protein
MPNKEAWHVLHEHPSGPRTANNAGELSPQARASTFNTFSLSGEADILAGETSADEIDRLELFRVNRADVFIAFHLRPMLLQNAAAERVDLHLPPALHAHKLQTQINAADASEQRAECHSSHASNTRFRRRASDLMSSIE